MKEMTAKEQYVWKGENHGSVIPGNQWKKAFQKEWSVTVSYDDEYWVTSIE